MSEPLLLHPYALPGWRVAHLAETDSTMAALRPLTTAEDNLLLTTDYQSAGRGRPGRSWEAERGRNLLFSAVLHPRFLPAREQFRLSQCLALSVAETIDDYADGVTVKWPNDVYIGDSKVCGMLLEHTLAGSHIAATLIGVGVNVNQTVFLSSAPNPVSLRGVTGREVDTGLLLDNLMRRFADRYARLQREGAATVEADYMARLYRREGYYPYRDDAGLFHACIVSIDPMGPITLRDTAGRWRTYAFGEVHHVI